MGNASPTWLAAQGIAAAFRDDPFYASLVAQLPPAAAQRHEVLARYFAYAIDEAAAHGRLHLAEPPAHGAAVWLLPEAAAARQQREAAKQQALATILGSAGLARYQAMISAMAMLTAPVTPAAGWYLSILGIAPGHQGRGIGTALLRPALAEADAHGALCYLETFGERTLSFYRRVGFAPVAAFVEPLSNARYWVLCRAPGAGG